MNLKPSNFKSLICTLGQSQLPELLVKYSKTTRVGFITNATYLSCPDKTVFLAPDLRNCKKAL